MTTRSKRVSVLDLGRLGIWTTSIRFTPGKEALEAACELEELGFRTIWIPGGMDDGVLASIDALLEATQKVQFATGIINIWKHEAADVAAWFGKKSAEHQGRLLLGLGVSHGPAIGDAWSKPVSKMREFLDGLNVAGMPAERLCLAALGPKMLALAAERTAGAHPYMVTTHHIAGARKILGPNALLAPELGVVFETNPGKAREIARELVKHYAMLPNYANNWRREGFSSHEIDTLDDRLIDAVIAWGDLDAIKARIDAYHVAGADHVCIQAISSGGFAADLSKNREDWRKLAQLLS